jgi:small subunit ribosomal protein S6
MREYEVMVIYDLTLAEARGADAAPEHLASVVEQHGGKMLQVDHWGRRRMAYPINNRIDGDYVVVRAEIEPSTVGTIERDLRINEQVFRWQVVRADDLPPFVPMARRPARPAQAAADEAPPPVAEPAEAQPVATETVPSEPPAAEPPTPVAAEPEAGAPAAEATPSTPEETAEK